MQYKDLEKLVRLIEASDFDEFEWETKSEKVRFKKSPSGAAVGMAYAPQMPAYAPAAAPAAAIGEPKSNAEAAAKPAAASSLKKVTSPFVGTYYEAPAPDAPKYVDAGKSFKKGDVLCIVEAMKIMNEIEAEFSGKIVNILVKNGQPVQYGQALFEIE